MASPGIQPIPALLPHKLQTMALKTQRQTRTDGNSRQWEGSAMLFCSPKRQQDATLF